MVAPITDKASVVVSRAQVWKQGMRSVHPFILVACTYLEVEVRSTLDVVPLGKALLLEHVVGQGKVSVGSVLLGEEDGIVEPDVLAASNSLYNVNVSRSDFNLAS